MNWQITDSIVFTTTDDLTDDDTVLLTVRGKDNDLTIADLRRLRHVCTTILSRMEAHDATR